MQKHIRRGGCVFRRRKKQLAELDAGGFGRLPVCIAKTQYSFSDDASLLAAPSGFTMTVRELRLSAGAGFVVVVMGNIMTMPGLPKKPAAEASTWTKKRRHQRPVLSAFWQTPHKKAYANSAAPKASLERRCFLLVFRALYSTLPRKSFKRAGFGASAKNSAGAASSHDNALVDEHHAVRHLAGKAHLVVTTTMVMPSRASCWITSSTSCTISGSSALVGSSNSITSGCMASARAMATRCCWPPESWMGYAPPRSPSPRAPALGQLVGLVLLHPFTSTGPALTLSSTVMLVNRLNCWNTMPIFWRIWSIFVSLEVMSTPSNTICPPVGSSNRFRQRKNVDLPEPDGPMTATTSPFADVDVDTAQHLHMLEVLLQALDLNEFFLL